MAHIKKKSHCWLGCEEKGTFIHCWWECQLIQSFWKTIWILLKKLEIKLPYNSIVLLLNIPTDPRIQCRKAIYTSVFIAALFTITRIYKQSMPKNCKYIKKLWYICTVEYYTFARKNEVIKFAYAWIDIREYCAEWNEWGRGTDIELLHSFVGY